MCARGRFVCVPGIESFFSRIIGNAVFIDSLLRVYHLMCMRVVFSWGRVCWSEVSFVFIPVRCVSVFVNAGEPRFFVSVSSRCFS